MLVAIAAEASEVLSREKSWTGFAEGTARGESKEQTHYLEASTEYPDHVQLHW